MATRQQPVTEEILRVMLPHRCPSPPRARRRASGSQCVRADQRFGRRDRHTVLDERFRTCARQAYMLADRRRAAAIFERKPTRRDQCVHALPCNDCAPRALHADGHSMGSGREQRPLEWFAVHMPLCVNGETLASRLSSAGCADRRSAAWSLRFQHPAALLQAEQHALCAERCAARWRPHLQHQRRRQQNGLIACQLLHISGEPPRECNPLCTRSYL